MKSRFVSYLFFIIISIVGVGLYFLEPTSPIFTVTMSIGAGLIGAVFVSIAIEAINLSNKRKYDDYVQKYMLCDTRASIVNVFRYLYGTFYRLIDKREIKNLDRDNLTQSYHQVLIDSKICLDGAKCRYLFGKIDRLEDNLSSLVTTLHSNIPILVGSMIVSDRDIEYFENLQRIVANISALDCCSDIIERLLELLNVIDKHEILRINPNEVLPSGVINANLE